LSAKYRTCQLDGATKSSDAAQGMDQKFNCPLGDQRKELQKVQHCPKRNSLVEDLFGNTPQIAGNFYI
jgi:hypothetical protein